MDPQQKLFSYLLMTLRESGYTVYDGTLPGPNQSVEYPFIYLGENQMMDDIKKQEVRGRVYQTIHVYHNDLRKRGTVSAILNEIKTMCRALENASGWLLTECTTHMLPDTTTDMPLIHGIVDVGFRF